MNKVRFFKWEKYAHDALSKSELEELKITIRAALEGHKIKEEKTGGKIKLSIALGNDVQYNKQIRNIYP